MINIVLSRVFGAGNRSNGMSWLRSLRGVSSWVSNNVSLFLLLFPSLSSAFLRLVLVGFNLSRFCHMVTKRLPWSSSLRISKGMGSFFLPLSQYPQRVHLAHWITCLPQWQKDRGPKGGAGAVLQRKGRLLLPEKWDGVLSRQREQLSTHTLHNCMSDTFTSLAKKERKSKAFTSENIMTGSNIVSSERKKI